MINSSEHDSVRKVTLEDLLRLKRAERPETEFWNRFEQDLRTKQLAAIVEPRPWWIALRLPQVARGLARFQVPVGAAAVLALSFVVVREYRPATFSKETISSVAAVNMIDANSASGELAAPVDQLSANAVVERTAATVMPEQVVHSSQVTSVSEGSADELGAVGPGGLMAMIPWAAPQSATVAEVPNPAVVLGELPQVHFASAMNPGREHDFEGRVEVEPVTSTTVAATEEAAAAVQVSPVSPREVRRNRLLSTMVVADNNSDAERSRSGQGREVLTSSLDDDRLYDSVRRVGMVGDRLTLKF